MLLYHSLLTLSVSLLAIVNSMPASVPVPMLKSDDIQNATVINTDDYQLENPAVQYPDDDFIGVPQPYEFGYNFGDSSGRLQHHRERADGTGKVLGRYGYVNEFGLYRTVEYIADDKGFRVVVRSNEPGLSNQNSANVQFIVEAPPEAILEQQRLLSDKSTSSENSDVLDEMP